MASGLLEGFVSSALADKTRYYSRGDYIPYADLTHASGFAFGLSLVKPTYTTYEEFERRLLCSTVIACPLVH